MTFYRLFRTAKKRLIKRPYQRGKYLFYEDFFSFLLGCFYALLIILTIALEVLIIYMFKYDINFSNIFSYLFPTSPLVDTPVCRIDDWPVFDMETIHLYRKDARLSSQVCLPKFMLENFTIRRVNYTWIEIDGPAADQWSCVGREVQRKAATDYLQFGRESIYLKKGLNDLTAEVLLAQKVNKSFHKGERSKRTPSTEADRWDAVMVFCLQKIFSPVKTRLLATSAKVVPPSGPTGAALPR